MRRLAGLEKHTTYTYYFISIASKLSYVNSFFETKCLIILGPIHQHSFDHPYRTFGQRRYYLPLDFRQYCLKGVLPVLAERFHALIDVTFQPNVHSPSLEEKQNGLQW